MVLGALTGWTLYHTAARLEDGPRQSDSIDVGQPNWRFMWAQLAVH